MKKNRLLLIWTTLLLTVVLTGCFGGAVDNGLLNIGYGGGFLSAPLYAADYEVNLHQFTETSDIVYGLAGGSLDAGFLEIDRFIALIESDTTFLDAFTVAGTIDYPFGATMIIREDLGHLRLSDINGLNIAVTSPSSALLEVFLEDAHRLGVETDDMTYTFMPFRTMVPALTEGVVDAIIVRGDFALVGLEAGHHILYQNWSLEPGDACCPGIVDQAAKVFLVRNDRKVAVHDYFDALMETRLLSPTDHRAAVVYHTNIPAYLLEGIPVPEFSPAGDELIEIFVFNRQAHDHNEH
ncbi:MAG: hypothetical protein FWG67_03725 [Defluviitaleaceae bacterium]|nr:hypothetical protein [Defluviitaleaceae bacterium]